MYSVLSAALAVFGLAAASSARDIVTLETRVPLDSNLANIHLSYSQHENFDHDVTYGPCESLNRHDAHHDIAHLTDSQSSRVVWFIPEDAESGGCLSAWEGTAFLGRSKPLELRRSDFKKRSEGSIPMTNASGIDTLGPWFDGVALLKEKEVSHVNVEEAKSKSALVFQSSLGLLRFLIITWCIISRNCNRRSRYVGPDDIC
jgi:hypothetical protein